MDNSPLLGKSRKTSFDVIPPLDKIDKDYGFNLEQNIKLTQSNPEISSIWRWLFYCRSSNLPFEGLLQTLEKTESKSRTQGLYSVHTSEEREKSLKICEWDFFTNSVALEAKLADAKSTVPDSKLAMYSIFAFSYHTAIRQILDSNILTPVIQNYQETDTNYLKLCKKLAKTQNDPFVKASLLFLSGPKQIGKIFKYLDIVDSAGLALRHLNDSELKIHLKTLLIEGEENGDLRALIISGFGPESVGILMKYLDKSGDLQTVAILSLFILQLNKSEVLENYVANYKSQLTRLEMFNIKCTFNIEEAKLLGKKSERGKVMRCYYCGNSVALNDVLTGSNTKLDSQSHDQAILNHCPSCPAPLPKCCVCLNGMKPINPYFINKTGKEVGIGLFIWCEKCHHGGHSNHVIEWFNENSSCPVYGCGCLCASLDN